MCFPLPPRLHWRSARSAFYCWRCRPSQLAASAMLPPGVGWPLRLARAACIGTNSTLPWEASMRMVPKRGRVRGTCHGRRPSVSHLHRCAWIGTRRSDCRRCIHKVRPSQLAGRLFSASCSDLANDWASSLGVAPSTRSGRSHRPGMSSQ
jgi:hypothetical protein